MAVNETIKNGFYRVYDPLNAIWRRIALWTKSEQVECADGNTVEEKIGAINGITDSLASNASDIAASAAAVNILNQNMGGLTFGKDGDGNYGYYGADGSLVPFRSTEIICLGIGTSFNLSGYKGYKNFSKNNFLLVYETPTAVVNSTIIGCYTSDEFNHVYPAVETSAPSLSYNASKGILSVTPGEIKTTYTRHSSGSGTITTATLPVKVYLIIGKIS